MGSSGSNSPFNFSPRVGLPVKGRAVSKNRSNILGSPASSAPVSKQATAASRQGGWEILAEDPAGLYHSVFMGMAWAVHELLSVCEDVWGKGPYYTDTKLVKDSC